MEKYIPLLYDLVAVIIILITMSRASLRGFTATIVTFVGNIAAFFGASFLSQVASEFLYKTFLQGQITNYLQTKLSVSSDLNNLLQQITELAESLPRLAMNIIGLGSLNESHISDVMGSTFADMLKNLEASIIRPATTSFLTMICFIILFAVFSFFVRRFADIVHWVCKIPVLQSIDRFLGGILGIVQAAINIYLICVIVHLLLYFVGPMQYLNETLILDTYIWRWIYNFDVLKFINF